MGPFYFTTRQSAFKLFTGFANAVRTAWKLTVTSVIMSAARPDAAKTHPDILILYT